MSRDISCLLSASPRPIREQVLQYLRVPSSVPVLLSIINTPLSALPGIHICLVELMQPEVTQSPFLCQRFHSLVWSCLDFDLHKSAVFYAERYYTMDLKSHDARHLYATALLRAGQTYSAMYLVNVPLEVRCSGCLEIKSKCCKALGRHRQAREALEECMLDTSYVPTRKSLHS